MNSLLCAASQHLIVPPPIFLPGQVLSIDPRHSDTIGLEVQDKSPFAFPIANHGVTLSDDIPSGLHPIHRSMYFSGDGYNRLQIPAQAFNVTLAGDFTVEFYFKPERHRIGSGAMVGQWAQIGGKSGLLFVINNGSVTFHYGPESDQTALLHLGQLDEGTWYHLAVSRHGAQFAGFKDGTVIDTRTSQAFHSLPDVSGYLGAYLNAQYQIPQNGGVPLQGWLCNVSIFDHARYTL